MKKILLCLLVILLIGCENNHDPKVNEPEIQLTKEEILFKYAQKMEKESPISTTKENIGSHYTSLDMMLLNSKEKRVFQDCNEYGTGIYFEIYEHDNQILKQTKLNLVCDNKLIIYYYNSLEDGAKPLAVTEKEI